MKYQFSTVFSLSHDNSYGYFIFLYHFRLHIALTENLAFLETTLAIYFIFIPIKMQHHHKIQSQNTGLQIA